MKKLLVIVLIGLFGGACYAQDMKTVQVPRGVQRQSKQIIDGVTTHNYATKSKIPINGNPYYKKDFTLGVLELHDGAKSDETLLRYNIARDAFEVIQKSDTLSLNQPYKLKQIFYENKTFIFDPELREKTDRKYNGFFEVCVDGKFTLYKKWRKDLVFDSFANNYKGGSGTKEYYYVDKNNFVGRLNGQKGFLLNSKKSFLNAINDESKTEMKAFIKKNKIKFNDEKDLIKLVQFYNEKI